MREKDILINNYQKKKNDSHHNTGVEEHREEVINSSWSLERSAGLVNNSFTENLINKLCLKV